MWFDTNVAYIVVYDFLDFVDLAISYWLFLLLFLLSVFCRGIDFFPDYEKFVPEKFSYTAIGAFLKLNDMNSSIVNLEPSEI